MRNAPPGVARVMRGRNVSQSRLAPAKAGQQPLTAARRHQIPRRLRWPSHRDTHDSFEQADGRSDELQMTAGYWVH